MIVAPAIAPTVNVQRPIAVGIDDAHTLFGRGTTRSVALRIDALAGLTNRLAPFDIVNEEGFYGPRRYVYHYDDQGKLLVRWTQEKSGSSWTETNKIVWTYTPTGHIETRTEFDRNFEGRVAQRDRHTYDADARMTSTIVEYFDPSTGMNATTRSDSIAYDSEGALIFSQWEWWEAGKDIVGSRAEMYTIDSLSVTMQYERTSAGWIPATRRSSVMDLEQSTYRELDEIWNGTRWVNSSRSSYIFALGDDGEVSSSWTWQEKEWVPDVRCLWLRSEDGLSGEFRNERWDGDRWISLDRELVAWDESWQWTYYKMEDWDNGWALRYSMMEMNEAEDCRRHIDTSWSHGSPIEVFDVTFGLDGADSWTELASTRLSFTDGIMSDGFSAQQNLNASRQTTDLSTKTCTNGKWEDFYRYVFTYGSDHRITSLRHEIYNANGWVRSYRSTPWDTTDAPGTWWTFNRSDDRSESSSFYGFTELSFVYRDMASGVTSDAGRLPTTSALAQNYPNPFNPTTTIPFSVATGVRTIVAIFDVLGREVARPVDAWKDPGEYRVEFDAKGLASGMYICRFTSGSVSQTRKLMLVR